MVRFYQTEQCSCENMFADVGEMFLIIVGSIALGTFIWFLLRKDPEPLLGVYSQPGIIGTGVVIPCDAMLTWYMLWPHPSCLSVHLSISQSQADVLLKWLNVSHKWCERKSKRLAGKNVS